MAIISKTNKPFIEDKDEKIFIGIKLPFTRGDNIGYFDSTTTTVEAIKHNIKSLLNTEPGERLLQPTIGVNLKKYLFEPIEEETYLAIEDEIVNKFGKWLPFVEIKDLDISTDEADTVGRNAILIKILFGIARTNNALETIEVVIQ